MSSRDDRFRCRAFGAVWTREKGKEGKKGAAVPNAAPTAHPSTSPFQRNFKPSSFHRWRVGFAAIGLCLWGVCFGLRSVDWLLCFQ